MPEFITLGRLREFSKKASTLKSFSASTLEPGRSTFLSHSTADHEYLPGVIEILEDHGAHVYTDDRDKELGDMSMLKKAERLRKTVDSCRKLVSFVTPNSRKSQWVTWELALADGAKNPSNVALFPSAETAYETAWAEHEYLGLYRRIVWGRLQGWDDPLWMVYDHHTNTAERLQSWLH